jgi:hypothetical protein
VGYGRGGIELLNGALGLVGDVFLDQGAVAVGVTQQLGLEKVDLCRQGVEAGREIPVLVLDGLLTGSESRGLVAFADTALLGGNAVPFKGSAPAGILGKIVIFEVVEVVVEILEVLEVIKVILRWGGRAGLGRVLGFAATLLGFGFGVRGGGGGGDVVRPGGRGGGRG